MPARLVIEGGVPLRGRVAVSAAKNATLPALAAALLTSEPVTLTNVPDLGDIRTMLRLLETHGAAVARDGRRVEVRVPRVANDEASYELVSTMRASVLVLGPLVARHGSARVALPGGCAIGVRPIDQHLKGLARLGADIATLLGLADGQSRVTETIFENRFMHAAELVRLGARIETDGAIAVVRGVAAYQGAPVMASDLRASAALVLAGLAARGTTEVSRIYHLDRGYEHLEQKLAALGARIERTSR